MDFEQSQTKKNLEAAFAGESQAHTKYRYYSSKAKKEGFVQKMCIRDRPCASWPCSRLRPFRGLPWAAPSPISPTSPCPCLLYTSRCV